MERFPAEKADELEQPRRYAEIEPASLLAWAGLRTGAAVLDLGCGTGFFARAAAQYLGGRGIVIGADVSRPMLQKAREASRGNGVWLVQIGEGSLPIATHSIDLAILGFVLHEVEEVGPFLREVRRVLREEGKLLVAEWVKREEERGPRLAHRLSEMEVRRLLAGHGFAITSTRTLGESYYALLAAKVTVRCCGGSRLS
ncbi:MAG: class I SAM-dependent methyltransferase [candidate division KSB1 bacterium]|nr:class I SAM-dependent methyltransferase [candidate division KSB1 bacterium]